MGIDLELKFMSHDLDGWGYDANRLSLDRDQDLWDLILRDLPQAVKPEGETFNIGGKPETEDNYGLPLKYTRPQNVRSFLTRHKREITGWNRRCLRLVANLPDNVKIFLFWC